MSFDNICPGWSSRTETLRERIDPQRVQALAATLDSPIDVVEGTPLPPGWQWLYFNPVAPRSMLAEDGHPRRDTPGSFLPPVALPRRMWAGSRIHYLRDVKIGSVMTRTSRITRMAEKEGRAGKLCFVTAEHRIAIDGFDCIVDEQDIVYREAGSSSQSVEPAPNENCEFRQYVTADRTLLFRYSALTFNGHRIHYDAPYARDVEHYRDLVVHGPLSATLLQNFARACKPDHRLCQFEFKGMSPLFVDETFELQASAAPQDANLLNMRVIDVRGALAMQATALFERR